MRIIEVDLPERYLNYGLGNIKMNRLGQVVLLAGKNGSGKSRLIKCVHGLSTHLERHFDPNPNHYNQRIKFENLDRNDKAVRYVPETPMLNSHMGMSKQNLNNSDEQIIMSEGFKNHYQFSYAYIQTLQNKWVEATRDNSAISDENKKLAINQYETLKGSISEILGTHLERNINGDILLFGKEVHNMNLSQGQSTLLQYCLALHAQNTTLNRSILFMDEPENHLHPSVLISTIDTLLEKNPDGQIWIATHSLPLLSHFDPNCIWYVEDGTVSYAGNKPERVLESLLGNEEQQGKLRDFISLPSIMALNRHAYECLLPPAVLNTDRYDPQTLQIGQFIKEKIKQKGKVKILDYGAGKGRLLANYIENNNENVEELKQQLDYIAFDEYNNDKKDCENIISNLYGNAELRYFNKHEDLLSHHNNGEFDVVVMCNVLHEVDIHNWVSLFKADGKITSLLSNDGYLLLVEDQEMPVGEKAYQKGFIVFNTPELKVLFEISGSMKCEKAYDGRLTAHTISKSELSNVSRQSIVNAIKSLKQKAIDKIKEIRESDTTYKNGKKHGFWVEQLANCELILIELE